MRKPDPKPKSTKPRNRWLDITKNELDTQGERVKSHPFLIAGNLKDQVIIRHCLVYKPFTAAFGQVSRAWNDVANAINNKADMDETQLFWPGLSCQAVKDRFEAYLKYAAASMSMNKVASRSGCDDEGPANEIQQGVEDLYQLFMDDKEAKGQAKQHLLASLKEGKEAAEFIRSKSLGEMVAADYESTRKKKGLRNSTSSSEPGSEKSKTSMNPGRSNESVDTISDQLGVRAETKREKIQLRKIQLDNNKEMKKPADGV